MMVYVLNGQPITLKKLYRVLDKEQRDTVEHAPGHSTIVLSVRPLIVVKKRYFL